MNTLLLVANFDSGVGYAWWLMESFWAALATQYHRQERVFLAYPSISRLPEAIKNAPLEVVVQDFNPEFGNDVIRQCRFLHENRVSCIYFTDKKTWHWRYVLYHLSGVRHIIVHDHTPGVRDAPDGIRLRLKQIAHRIPLFSVDGAIGATEFVRQRLIKVNGLPAERCHTAPNGLPPAEIRQIPKDLHQLFKIPMGRKVMVMTGRANRYKGVEFVFQCLAHLLSNNQKEVHFLFIGDGPHLDWFKSIAFKSGIVDHCTFAGRRTDIPALLEGADIAIHPSKGEVGYSLSILEYMRAGLPVVVPDNPSVSGATEQGVTGMIFPEGNVQAATSIVSRLLSDEGFRKKLSSNARKASQRYRLEETHDALLRALNHIRGL